MRILLFFCSVLIVYSSAQLTAPDKTVSNGILDDLLNLLSGLTGNDSEKYKGSDFKPPKQIEEPVNNIPARGSNDDQPSKTEGERVPLWKLEERGRLANLNKQGGKDESTSSEEGTVRVDSKKYCKQDRLALVDPRTLKPVPCSVSTNRCPSTYSCDAIGSTNAGFCCMDSGLIPSVKSGPQDQLYNDYCRQGFMPITECRPNTADACSLFQGAICDNSARYGTATSGYCCLPIMTTSTTSTTTTTTTTTTPSATTTTSPSTTSSTTSSSSTSTTSLGPTSGLYCGTKGVLVELISADFRTPKRCSTSGDCSKGFDCDRSGAIVQDKLGYCCSKLPPVTTTTTAKTPKSGNAAGTILHSSGMLLLIAVAAGVSYSMMS